MRHECHFSMITLVYAQCFYAYDIGENKYKSEVQIGKGVDLMGWSVITVSEVWAELALILRC
jgi:hypothetical protein